MGSEEDVERISPVANAEQCMGEAEYLGFVLPPVGSKRPLMHKNHAIHIFVDDFEASDFTLRVYKHDGFLDGVPQLGPEVWSMTMRNVPVARFRNQLRVALGILS